VRITSVLLPALILISACATATQQSPRVFFVEPKDGATVGQEFKVVMGVEGMEVKPAGDATPNSGHHHLLVNAEDIAQGTAIPVDQPDKYKHFGKAQTEAMLKLPPGKYKLTLQFADAAHRSLGEKLRSTINVNVQ
jgi:Domain of unknown function (DUF4399)